jgi:uncharacterized protein (DUF885 family)
VRVRVRPPIDPAALTAPQRINYQVYRARIAACVEALRFREYDAPVNADSAFWTDATHGARLHAAARHLARTRRSPCLCRRGGTGRHRVLHALRDHAGRASRPRAGRPACPGAREALAYLRDNTALPDHEVTTEVDRTISWPGRALSYYLGQMAIMEARAKAEKALASRIDRFIAEGGKSPYPPEG